MKKIQLPRGVTAVNDTYTGLGGQLTADTDRWELRLHDGVTPGGHRIANLEQLALLFMSKDSEFGQVVFDEGDRGVLTRIGDKQYALRLLDGYNGIKVATAADGATENNNGQDADFFIGLDPTFLESLITTAGRIAWCGDTTGTASAFTVTTPVGWKDRDGAVLAFRFHVAGADNATLGVTIDGGDAADTVLSAAPILTANNEGLVSHVITANRVVIAMRVGTNFLLIGEAIARDIGIEPIEGLTATNVQDALAELWAKFQNLDSNSSGNYYKFANFSQNPSRISGSNYKLPLKANERRLLYIITHPDLGGTVTGPGDTGPVGVLGTAFTIFMIIRYPNDQLRITQVASKAYAQPLLIPGGKYPGPDSLGWSATTLYRDGDYQVAGGFTVIDDDNISMSAKYTYSDVGVKGSPPSTQTT